MSLKIKKCFTLVELLVVIAVIGVLMTMLLPSLGKAREAGLRTVCLNNTKQWCTGAVMYHDEYGEFWDANNYPYRSTGKKGNTGWGAPNVTQRAVNPFMGYVTNDTEVLAASCPKDTYWKENEQDSAYDALGTSYCDNMAANTISMRGGSGSKSLIGQNLGMVTQPSKCLLFMEWPVVSQAYRPNEAFTSWHLRQQFFNVGMVDGSARYLKILVGQNNSANFHFEYDR